MGRIRQVVLRQGIHQNRAQGVAHHVDRGTESIPKNERVSITFIFANKTNKLTAANRRR